jgi:putative transposase
MLVQPYRPEELRFAWCYRVYYRWRTYRARAQPALAGLTGKALANLVQPYGIHVLELSATETDVRMLCSLVPAETVAVCASKTKGRISKWLREQLGLRGPERHLGRGYFASTTGQSTAATVDQYLESQGEHHGYSARPLPPVLVQCYAFTSNDQKRLASKHAVTNLQFHLVLATWNRKGVFGPRAAEAVAESWRQLQTRLKIALVKVSFVPDHVHLALKMHPSMAPAEVVTTLMNSAQELVWRDFDHLAIQAGAERLWQPSAYFGSYGDLESAKIAAYVQRWEKIAAL